MKNKFLIFTVFFALSNNINAENLNIRADSIVFDKKNQQTIFNNNVIFKDENGIEIKSNYAEYKKDKNLIILKNDVKVNDFENNLLKANEVIFDNSKKILKTVGKTSFISTEGYIIESSNIVSNNNKKLLFSKRKTEIKDLEGNFISLENFEYNALDKIFKSIGKISIIDNRKNKYLFSQMIIDTKEKEMIGTDIKAYFNDESFKPDKRNKPRIFANTINFKKEKTSFKKSSMTFCDYRKNDKCPPWELRAKNILHDQKSKTIYYDNVLLKIYNIPVIYFPYFFHPDPSVKRRSGFLTPTFNSSKTLGSSLTLPYFYAMDKDKDLTFTTRTFTEQHPLFLTEYRHIFKNSSLVVDASYTDGLKKKSNKIDSGSRSHFFFNYKKDLNIRDRDTELNFNFQNISNRKYLKNYKIETLLVDHNKDILENYLSINSFGDEDIFSFETQAYKNLKDNKKNRYEYIVPNLTYNANLFDFMGLGNGTITSNFKVENYETNKTNKSLINDLILDHKNIFFENGFNTKILSQIKNVNYEAKNINHLKSEPTNEMFGALGILSEVNFLKNFGDNHNHLLRPKFLLRYAPGNMKRETSGGRINSLNIFSLNRVASEDNFEKGLNATLGFDYQIDKYNNNFKFSGGQIINQNENKDMSSESSLDEKLSDFVGSASANLNNKVNFSYDFALDQNYKDLNYRDFQTSINLDVVSMNFNYLKEKEHYGNNEYLETKLNYNISSKGKVSLKGKRNLITNSSDYYDLSYEYFNDCLKAGLVYRREFYNDSETEPENSLMFKITLIPFGNLASQSIDQ